MRTDQAHFWLPVSNTGLLHTESRSWPRGLSGVPSSGKEPNLTVPALLNEFGDADMAAPT